VTETILRALLGVSVASLEKFNYDPTNVGFCKMFRTGECQIRTGGLKSQEGHKLLFSPRFLFASLEIHIAVGNTARASHIQQSASRQLTSSNLAFLLKQQPKISEE
jgi:hypothetical protein